MNCRIVESGGARFAECAEPIVHLDDALDLVAACAEHAVDAVLVEAPVLPADFFDLRTRFAGELIQKLLNYGIRIAAVLEADAGRGEKFAAFLAEARRGRQFRAFSNRADAEAWIAAAPFAAPKRA